MNDWLRTLFSIRTKRRTPTAGPIPPVGATVSNGQFRMRVTNTMPRDLWEWMVLSGWRNVPVAKDRRTYVDLPENAFAQLLQAAPGDRDILHARLLRVAGKSAG